MVEKVPMTQGGYTKLQEELRWRQQSERPRIIEAISEARAHGDLSENAEYHAAKEAQSHNEGRIGELEDYTSRAEIIDVSKMSGDTVKFGATVRLVDEDTDEEKTYQIVGDQEADVKAGPDFDLIADLACPDRQVGGRFHRGCRTRRLQGLRDPRREVGLIPGFASADHR
jgi:transcription elongation factor GreA